jgi:proliferating cell nuclear antigen|tara:strand:- start:109 stop:894 length:786 start_codon:yes stop_codon:yes gene_type:complete
MENVIFEIKTIQSSIIKTLIEALKEILNDTVIEINSDCIKVVTMDNSHIILVHLKLFADKFEFYNCNRPISIGINMLNLYKIIKTVNNNDIITFFVYNDNLNHLGIKIENMEKNTKTTYFLNLLDLNNEQFDIPEVQFNSVITLPSNDFQKLMRDMNNLADFVEIKNVDNKFILTCSGDFCSQETVLSDNDLVNINNKNHSDIIQGIFNLKYLVLFTKCTNLSNNVELYLKNNYPLIIRYNVASLGSLKLCLSPQSDDNID